MDIGKPYGEVSREGCDMCLIAQRGKEQSGNFHKSNKLLFWVSN